MSVEKLAQWSLFFLMIGLAYSQTAEESLSGSNSANAEVIGQVVDSAGKGMPGVTVWIAGTDTGAINSKGVNATNAFNAVTNSSGYYGFIVPVGNYTIMADLPEYSFTSSAVEASAENTTLARMIAGFAAVANPSQMQPPLQPLTGNRSISPRIYPSQLYPSQTYAGALGGGTGTLEGRIMDQSGAGIPTAAIYVDGFKMSSVSDEQGYYQIALNPGLHRVDASKEGFGIPPRMILVLADQTSTLDLIGKRAIALGR